MAPDHLKAQFLRAAAVRYAWSFLGLPYHWSGDDPIRGFDCCIPDDELIYTPNGPKFINQIQAGDLVYSINDKREPSASTVEGIFDNGRKDCVYVKTIRRKVCFSKNHPILCYRPHKAKRGAAWTVRQNADLNFVPASDLRRGDWLIVSKDLGGTKKSVFSKEAMRFMGAMLGDGSIHKDENGFSLAFYDERKRNLYSKLLKEGFDYRNKITFHQTHGMNFFSAPITQRFCELGFHHPSYEKEIPHWVFGESEENQRAFIEGYADADGYRFNRADRGYSGIHFACSSWKLIKQLNHLLLVLGEQVTTPTISKRKGDIYIKGKLVKNARDLWRFDWYNKNRRNGKTNLFITNPHDLMGLSPEFDFEKVLAIEPAGEKRTWNLSVSPDNTFIVHGIVTHNSGLIVEVLQSVGLLLHGTDMTANGFYLRYKSHAVVKGYAGCLCLWFNQAGLATHIEMLIDDYHTIGASGGGSSTTSTDAAAAQNAFIKMRPLGYRGGAYKLIDPFLGVA